MDFALEPGNVRTFVEFPIVIVPQPRLVVFPREDCGCGEEAALTTFVYAMMAIIG